MDQPQKRMGRPPKAPEDRRRHHQSFRTSEKMRAALQAAADGNQRSMSEEAEARLEQSFAKGMIDPKTQQLADLIAMSLMMNQVGMPKPWHEARHTPAARYLWKRISLLAARVMGVIPADELHEDVRQQALDAERKAADDNMREAATSDTLKGYFGAVLASTRPMQTAEELRSELGVTDDPIEDHALTLEEEVEADKLMVEIFGDAPAEKPKRGRKTTKA